MLCNLIKTAIVETTVEKIAREVELQRGNMSLDELDYL